MSGDALQLQAFHPDHGVGIFCPVFIAEQIASLLFIIPGIIKSYSYRMVPYILIENPDIAPNEAIARSRDMMNGHEGATFVLDLSFIGWVLLGVISLGIAIILYESPYYYSTHAEQYRTMTEVTYDRNDYYGETY